MPEEVVYLPMKYVVETLHAVACVCEHDEAHPKEPVHAVDGQGAYHEGYDEQRRIYYHSFHILTVLLVVHGGTLAYSTYLFINWQ